MLRINGKTYFIDINQFEKLITIIDTDPDNPYEEIISEIYNVEEISKQAGEEQNEDEDIGDSIAMELLSQRQITKQPKQKKVDSGKYEIIMNLINILANANSEGDPKIEQEFSKMTLGEKLAFNTLYRYKVLTDKIV